MIDKTKEELAQEVRCIKCMELERERADKAYAKIIVQNIVYTAIGVIAVTFLYLLLTNIKWR